jgi:hypothetical protein
MEPFKILPVLICRKGQVKENFMEEKVKKLGENLKIPAQILEHAVINEEGEIPLLKERLAKADAILLYKPHLGLGNCVVKILEYNLPIILFSDEGIVRNPLDALEYIYPAENVWVAVDYQDINNYLTALLVKKRMEQTKILVLMLIIPIGKGSFVESTEEAKPLKKNLGLH